MQHQARAEAEAAYRWARYAQGHEPEGEEEHEEEDHNIEDDSADEHDDEGPWEGERVAGGAPRQRLPLHHFLRIMAGARVMERVPVNATNADLLAHLRKTGALTTDEVTAALRMCGRDLFVPREHQAEALTDSPIHLDIQDFNISAPHMHATCLEALKLRPGHRFLDVGSGCGVLTAAAAYLVGKTGASVGIDIKPCAVELSRANVRRLATTRSEFSDAAAPVSFSVHNVFLPSAKHKGMYDKIHVGAACPQAHLSDLTALLGPNGGEIVTPVATDLRLISVAPDGTATQKILSSVRYSDLVVPSDTEIVAAMVEEGRAARTAVPPPASSFTRDCAAILGRPLPSPRGLGRRSSTDSDMSAVTPMSKGVSGRMGGDEGSPRWVPEPMKRLGKLLTSCGSPPHPTGNFGSLGPASSLGASSCSMLLDDEEVGGSPRCPPEEDALDCATLGPHDATLAGSGWSLPLHSAVLRERCEHGRARSGSGMRDAEAATINAPDATPDEAASAFVSYLYTDRLEVDACDAQLLAAVLHLAIYFGAPRLISLAEAALAATLQLPTSPDFDPVEAAPALLALADECGLPHLAATAASFCIGAYQQVKVTPQYAALSARQMDLIVSEACDAVGRYQDALKEVSSRKLLPEPENTFF